MALVGDEQGPQALGMRVDVEAQLGQNSEPDVLRPEGEVMVPAICVVGRPYQTVRGGGNVFSAGGDERGLKDAFALIVFIAAGRFEQVAL